MRCSLEVLAPTLSRVPLCIRPHHQTNETDNNQEEEEMDSENGEFWIDGLESGFETNSQPEKKKKQPVTDDRAATEDISVEIWKAAQLYLGRPFDISNTAHAVVPIRIGDNR